ncbi:response regulator transcription factor [Acidipropionibacterium virtanenii]|uniref:Response regulator ArlR n=1 Tax=Acidipropionibacterium virtanenii TaxID=2057246 RepID=A0A344UQ34_9ACTN|nr:response regulator transcription factor [Acidipropionibacterium virtanenii]AXE37382.1 Response regulator ArlR [Acidipropionibacterium virtanenii]
MTRPVVLVVEDDRETARLLGELFSERGYRVVTAASGPDGIRLAHAEQPDLVLLDLMLPFKSGDEVLRAVRTESDVPVIVISARQTTRSKIDLLQLGADDYLTKPFDVDELVARCEATMRRTRHGAGLRTVHRVGELELDETARTASIGGAGLALTATEFGLLTVLMRGPRLVHPKPSLYQQVWGRSAGYEEHTVNAHMHNLRRKLRDAGGEDPIRTVWGIGYTLKES